MEEKIKQTDSNLETENVSILQQWLDIKCEKIDQELKNLFSENKKAKFLYPKIIKIFKTDNRSDLAKKRIFDDPNDILYALDKFQDIIAYINDFDVFVPEIENFSFFMGWTSSLYKKISESKDGDMQEAMKSVEDYIFGCQYAAGQLGILKGNLTKFRSQLDGTHGQGVVTQKESNDIDKSRRTEKSKEQMMEELKNMGFYVPEQIANNTSKKDKNATKKQ